jgi:PKD repeat protein
MAISKSFLKQFLTSIVFIATFGYGTIINVPSEAWSIQNGIDIATEGDTVLVQPGTYYESLNVNKVVVLGSLFLTTGDTNYIDATIIDGYNSLPCVAINSSTTIRGFKVTNGLEADSWVGGTNGGYIPGGGIQIIQSGTWCIEVTDMKIVNNTAEYGGGIGIGFRNNGGSNADCLMTFKNLIIESNSAGINGGAIFTNGGAFANFENCIIKNNTCDFEQSTYDVSGVKIKGASAITFTKCQSFNNNWNKGASGCGSLLIDQSLFVESYISLVETCGSLDNGTTNHITKSTFVESNVHCLGACLLNDGISTTISSSILSSVSYVTHTNGGVTCDPVHYIEHSLIPGGYDGPANIDGDPMFVDPANGNFNLSWDNYPESDETKSPCIDTGHPNPIYYDADGTRSDMGAFPFNQAAPIVDFSATPLTGNSPLTVQFNDLSTTGLYGTGLSEWDWDFGDGNVSSEQNLSHTYTGGIYDVSLTVLDASGFSNTETKAEYIYVIATEVHNLDIGEDEDLMHLVNHTPMITFDFYNNDGGQQSHYQIQVSTFEEFDMIDMWDTGEEVGDAALVAYVGNPLADGLADGETYFLRVRLKSQGLWSEWSSLTFQMNTEPTTPVLVSPINNQVSGTPVVLNVLNGSDAESDAVTYSFNVYDDAELTTILDSVTDIEEGIDTTIWQVAASLYDNGQFFWTASTNDGYEESTVSDAGSFLLNTDNNPPDMFTLSMPLVNTAVQSLSPVFSWHPASDPDPIDTVHYTLILDTPDPGVEVFEVGTDTSFQVPDPLMDNTQYYWQVIAEDLLGFQTVSEGGYQTFYTNMENDPPTASTLVAPLYGSIQTGLTPNFYWTEADDPDPMDEVSYILFYQEYDAILTLPLDTNAYTPEEDLLDNFFYSWYVHSIDLNGAESISETSQFYTDAFPEPPSNFATIIPENNAEGIPTEVEFVWNETDDPDPVEEIHYQLVYATDWQDSSTYVYSDLLEDTSLTVSLEDNSQYYWIVVAMDTDGFIVGSNDNMPNTMVVGTLSIDGADIPEVFALHQNYPNPFNPTTQIKYDLPEDALVAINIYDLMGRSIKSLVNSNQSAGYRSIQWNATNNLGEPVSAGMYIYMIQAGEFRQTKKMVLLK